MWWWAVLVWQQFQKKLSRFCCDGILWRKYLYSQTLLSFYILNARNKMMWCSFCFWTLMMWGVTPTVPQLLWSVGEMWKSLRWIFILTQTHDWVIYFFNARESTIVLFWRSVEGSQGCAGEKWIYDNRSSWNYDNHVVLTWKELPRTKRFLWFFSFCRINIA